ncbi:MAG TPA: TIGR00269 family protein [Nitrososphaera sp.]|nr:TIGR00269 family protein [Nitrososphaera sp.]
MPYCNKCQKAESIYYRAYSGEYLCKKCFLRSIEDKAARTISKYSMIEYGDNVAVGVSGGKDSLSLLYVLKLLFDQHPNNGNELIAVTIDEGIKGYRDESLQIVKDFCAKLRVESKVLSYKSLFGIDMDEAMILRSSSPQKMSSCSICGTFRRRAIDIAAETVGADIVVTAHNMDDQLQTFMINLLAGDVERIGWIYPEPVQYTNTGLKKVKPFIEIYEYEIAFYALQREIPFQSEECPYMNESIRTDLREFFNRLERDRPGIKYNAYNSMMKVSKILRSMPSSSESKKCGVCGRVSTGDVCSMCKTLGVLTSNKQI